MVRSPEEAVNTKEGHFDYVVLCVKALPDVYDLASVIDSVVVPQHTCILVNTTNAIGVEAAIEERYPTNVVLSLVAGADLTQLGQSEFEHKGSTELWIGPAKRNSEIPATIQDDMSSALAMTLSTGQVDAKVSPNIRQHQYERVIGSVPFPHPFPWVWSAANSIFFFTVLLLFILLALSSRLRATPNSYQSLPSRHWSSASLKNCSSWPKPKAANSVQSTSRK